MVTRPSFTAARTPEARATNSSSRLAECAHPKKCSSSIASCCSGTAPAAVPVCSQVAAMVSVDDIATRPARALADGEVLRTGRRAFKWLDTPHVPHGWECGFMMELETRTLLCGDLFTQGGSGAVALTEGDILGPSEDFRRAMDYYAHAPQTGAILERLAREQPQILACMHGRAWRGDGASPAPSKAPLPCRQLRRLLWFVNEGARRCSPPL